MLFLEGLVHLEVLDLDRTMVTNDGANVIGGQSSFVFILLKEGAFSHQQ